MRHSLLRASAFAPANISCIFKMYTHKNPRWSGSLGIGFTINEGVVVEVKKAKKTTIYFNNKKIVFPTVISLLQQLTKERITVRISSKLPLGCGFGLSGGSALATAYAINKLLHLKKTNKQLAVLAHTAEVVNKTGLGDVVNQYYGGLLVKLQPSAKFLVKKIPHRNTRVYCAYFSPLSTPSVLSNKKLQNKIDEAAEVSLRQLQMLYSKQQLSFTDVVRIAKEYVQKSTLLKNRKVRKTIEDIEKSGGNASMIVLGNGVLSDIPFPGAKNFFISDIAAHLL